MISLNTRLDTRNKQTDNQGFTIVELLIVIVVIAILALLVITTYGGIQAKARNAKRQSDIVALQTHIEAYYTQAQAYPTLADMTTATWMTTNMKGLDLTATQDPSETCAPSAQTAAGSGPTAPCIKGGAAAVAGSYYYAPLPASCVDTSGATACATYTLTATMESGAPAYTKTQLD